MPSPNPSASSLPNAAAVKGQPQQQSTTPESEPSPFPLMVVAQHGKDPTQPTLHSSQCNADLSPFVDFPGQGEDEIAFQKGEIIVVIAKDEGFGDGWWTVTTPTYPPCSAFSFPSLLSLSSLPSLVLWPRSIREVGWVGVGEVYARLRDFALHMHRSCTLCLWDE